LSGTGVKQVPEPVSPRYRNRVREVSSRYRSHGVKHEPEFHKELFDQIVAISSSTPADIGYRRVIFAFELDV
jgi:hypothetical protein